MAFLTDSNTDSNTGEPASRRRRRTRLAGLLLLIPVATIGFAGCGDDDDSDNPAIEAPAGDDGAEPAGETTATTAAETGGSAAAANTITMKLVVFNPDEVTIPVGSTVTWIHDDTLTHTVTSGIVESGGGTFTAKPDGKFDSGNMVNGDEFTFTFSEPGDLPFYCSLHASTMDGVVHVQ